MASEALRDWLVRATVDPSLRWTAPSAQLTEDDRALVADPARLTALVTGLPDDWPTEPDASSPPAPTPLAAVDWALELHPAVEPEGIATVVALRPWRPPAPHAVPCADTASWRFEPDPERLSSARSAVLEDPSVDNLEALMRALSGHTERP